MELNAALSMQMAFTECDFPTFKSSHDSSNFSASYAELFAAIRDLVITLFHIYTGDVDRAMETKGTNCINHKVADGLIMLTRCVMQTLQAVGYEKA